MEAAGNLIHFDNGLYVWKLPFILNNVLVARFSAKFNLSEWLKNQRSLYILITSHCHYVHSNIDWENTPRVNICKHMEEFFFYYSVTLSASHKHLYKHRLCPLSRLLQPRKNIRIIQTHPVIQEKIVCNTMFHTTQRRSTEWQFFHHITSTFCTHLKVNTIATSTQFQFLNYKCSSKYL